MKLTAENSKFAVCKTAFHNGGTILFTNSLKRAIDVAAAECSGDCQCGCAGVVAITKEARTEMLNYRNKLGEPVWEEKEDIPMYDSLPTYQANGESYWTLCK